MTKNTDLRLGVNVDHVATLRQARGTVYPSPVEAAFQAMAAGADSITVHLREDRRHIQDADVATLCAEDGVPVNLEMALTEEMLAIATRLRPRDVCLVPEKRAELTTEGGLDIAGQRARVRAGVQKLADAGINPALFIDPEADQIRAAAEVGAARIELHTGAYADAQEERTRAAELERVGNAAELTGQLGLEVHAGHGLNTANVAPIAALPNVVELNIGHA
jgi:pyridoxine 5-phosphate synthase